jgi:hypothetical protein
MVGMIAIGVLLAVDVMTIVVLIAVVDVIPIAALVPDRHAIAECRRGVRVGMVVVVVERVIGVVDNGRCRKPQQLAVIDLPIRIASEAEAEPELILWFGLAGPFRILPFEPNPRESNPTVTDPHKAIAPTAGFDEWPVRAVDPSVARDNHVALTVDFKSGLSVQIVDDIDDIAVVVVRQRRFEFGPRGYLDVRFAAVDEPVI